MVPQGVGGGVPCRKCLLFEGGGGFLVTHCLELVPILKELFRDLEKDLARSLVQVRLALCSLGHGGFRCRAVHEHTPINKRMSE